MNVEIRDGHSNNGEGGTPVLRPIMMKMGYYYTVYMNIIVDRKGGVSPSTTSSNVLI